MEGVLTMTGRLVLICTLLLPILVQATVIGSEDIALLQAGVVKITAKPPGESPKVGSGFVVRFDKESVYIITAAHVVSGDSRPQVEFFPRRNEPVPAEVLPGAEGADEVRGLAMLVVRGNANIPTGITALQLASNIHLTGGEEILLIGFPRGVGPWAIIRGNISSRQGRDIYFSPTVSEGNSGGPIIQSGKVIGLVGAGSQSIGLGITASSLLAYIDGFGITLQQSTSSLDPPPPTTTTKLEPHQIGGDSKIIGKDGAPMVLVTILDSLNGMYARSRFKIDGKDVGQFQVSKPGQIGRIPVSLSIGTHNLDYSVSGSTSMEPTRRCSTQFQVNAGGNLFMRRTQIARTQINCELLPPTQSHFPITFHIPRHRYLRANLHVAIDGEPPFQLRSVDGSEDAVTIRLSQGEHSVSISGSTHNEPYPQPFPATCTGKLLVTGLMNVQPIPFSQGCDFPLE